MCSGCLSDTAGHHLQHIAGSFAGDTAVSKCCSDQHTMVRCCCPLCTLLTRLQVTHKLIDNLKLFHELAGPVFGPGTQVGMRVDMKRAYKWVKRGLWTFVG